MARNHNLFLLQLFIVRYVLYPDLNKEVIIKLIKYYLTNCMINCKKFIKSI